MLTSFIIKFKDPRFYTENIIINITDEVTGDNILDVPFEVANGYGVRAVYTLTRPGYVLIHITIDGHALPPIRVRVDGKKLSIFKIK